MASAHVHAAQAREDATIVLARERAFRLGAVEVRPSTREVIGPRGRAVLEPRVMQVLVVLAQADGEILGRDELIARCWDGRAVGEDAITRVISRLRRLSEGLGRDGWTLETITKVGYRLLPPGADPEAKTALPGPAPSRRTILAGGAGIAGIAGAGAFAIWRFRGPAVPAEARELYDKAREAMRQNLPQQNVQAVAFLREAVAIAPDYADAWGALAMAYHASLMYTPPARQEGVFGLCAAAARRALELDPDNPQGAAATALLTPIYRNWLATEPLYARAVRLHPQEATLQAAYARFLMSVGRLREALTAAQAAVDADDFSPFNRFVLGSALWSVGRTEEADLTVRRALERWPRHYALWFLQFYLLSHTGRADLAVAFGDDLENRPIGIPAPDVEVGMVAARAVASRSPRDVQAAVEAQMDAARRGVGYAENAMGWMSALDRLDEAFAIGRALYFAEGFAIGPQRFSPDQGRFQVGGKLNTNHLFMPPTAPMRTDARFGVLMSDLGIARYWRSSGRGPDDPAWARGVPA